MDKSIDIDAFVHMLVSIGERWLPGASSADDIVDFVNLAIHLLDSYESSAHQNGPIVHDVIEVNPIGTTSRIRQPHKPLMKVFADELGIGIKPLIQDDQTWVWRLDGDSVRVRSVEAIMAPILTAYDKITRKMIDNLSLPTAEKREARKQYTAKLAEMLQQTMRNVFHAHSQL